MTKRKQAAPGEPVAMRYIGGGAYLPGIPARDLSAAEAAKHWATIQTAIANGQRLYEPAQAPVEDGE